MPLVPSFQLRLKDQIHEGLSTVGRYDGKRPTLTAATAGGRVLMYDPYAPEENGESVRYLNINKKITAVSSGALDPTVDRDVLLVGTATDLLAYDVDENKDPIPQGRPGGRRRHDLRSNESPRRSHGHRRR